MLTGKLPCLKVDAQRLRFVFKDLGRNSQKRRNATSRLMFFTTVLNLDFAALRRELTDFSMASFHGRWYQVHCPHQRE